MAPQSFKVIVVGGGPVGLTAAHALHHAGIDFTVLESRSTPVLDLGASIVLSSPSLRIMHQFGILERLLKIGGPLQHAQSMTRDGQKIVSSQAIFEVMTKTFGIAPVTFHRAHLVETLYETLPATAKDCYLMNKKVDSIVSDDTGVRVTCTDGSTYDGSIVIGADGVHSKTRRNMRELALKENPQRDWDAAVPFPALYRCMWCSFPRVGDCGQSTDTQSPDMSTMFLVGRERGWVFLYERLPEATTSRVDYTEEDRNAYAAKFADFPVTDKLKVKDVYANRLTEGMANLEEGILKHWSWGRIVLAGDACHKYTPNAGRGFINGIQDVVALCNGLHEMLEKRSDDDLPDLATLGKTFADYQQERSAAVKFDGDQSYYLSRRHAWANWFWCFISCYVLSYEWLLIWIMSSLAAKQLRKSLVLKYIHVDEPFLASVQWDHPLRHKKSE
ncbi:Monooxygenase, FAD-binding [Penicillium italicum]|uniref:Monooxygenase, FAD-binding n=1 Tax=Penicillium italicum TaxID=40296 RepID=A0A0A2LAJ5_PENIT|nr:Monooxygenase, FAD-binding [Penicillium italicum]